MKFLIEHACVDDLAAIKQICDQHRTELGFVMRPSLEAAIKAKEVIVARNRNDTMRSCIGLVHYHHRRDQQTTLYHLAVSKETRLVGVGRELVFALRDEARKHQKTLIRLKCPETLPANLFYAKIGFVKVSVEPGKSRPLWIWELAVN
ncbi:MAG: GNAT family N-acetyltransferase [Anaerolineae bacterium]|jgi:N-acetylglutamate synthase-like GNAT family acetyltransferase|nr:GNAT family N-acetyltransferase [Anaerolineae bacterium]